jgi:hypothetical protein
VYGADVSSVSGTTFQGNQRFLAGEFTHGGGRSNYSLTETLVRA